MSYDYSRLRGKIVEICKTNREFAKQIGLSERTVSLKLNNLAPFTQQDIEKSVKVLNLTADDVQDYFFTKEVL